jgi:hypothetical protein
MVKTGLTQLRQLKALAGFKEAAKERRFEALPSNGMAIIFNDVLGGEPANVL